jgi:hypothetical protein
MRFLLGLVLVAALVFGGMKLSEWFSGAPAPVVVDIPSFDLPPQFAREFSNSLVFVEGKTGAGSGFICAFGNAKFVVTNQHVVAGNPGVKFTLLDQSPISTGQAAAAVGHDIMTFALLSDAKAMEIMTGVETNAAIGDEVAVLGNSNGDRVIKPITGKLVGIGPDRVEVSAAFVPGNSGSPIVHVKSRKVLGIATYVTTRQVDSITGKPKEQPEIKRFGYRLDSVKQWQPIAWPAFVADNALLEKIKARSDDFLKLAGSANPSSMNYEDTAIRHALERFADALHGRGFIKTDRRTAVTDLIGGLRNACETDIVQAQAQMKYDFFRRELEKQRQFRLELYRGFDGLLKRIPIR